MHCEREGREGIVRLAAIVVVEAPLVGVVEVSVLVVASPREPPRPRPCLGQNPLAHASGSQVVVSEVHAWIGDAC